MSFRIPEKEDIPPAKEECPCGVPAEHSAFSRCVALERTSGASCFRRQKEGRAEENYLRKSFCMIMRTFHCFLKTGISLREEISE